MLLLLLLNSLFLTRMTYHIYDAARVNNIIAVELISFQASLRVDARLELFLQFKSVPSPSTSSKQIQNEIRISLLTHNEITRL